MTQNFTWHQMMLYGITRMQIYVNDVGMGILYCRWVGVCWYTVTWNGSPEVTKLIYKKYSTVINLWTMKRQWILCCCWRIITSYLQCCFNALFQQLTIVKIHILHFNLIVESGKKRLTRHRLRLGYERIYTFMYYVTAFTCWKLRNGTEMGI